MKNGIVIILLIILYGCANYATVFKDGKLSEPVHRDELSKDLATVTSSAGKEINNLVNSYFEDTLYFSKLFIISIDGISPEEATNNKYSQFSSYLDNTYNIKLEQGEHSFLVMSNALYKGPYKKINIQQNLLPGHEYLLAKVGTKLIDRKHKWQVVFIDQTENKILYPDTKELFISTYR